MIEHELDITTPEGEMKTFIYHPEHEGPHPERRRASVSAPSTPFEAEAERSL